MDTTLDHMSPREQIVSPAVVAEVIGTAHRYGAACFSGAFKADEAPRP